NLVDTTSKSLCDNPLHPYTKALLSAVPLPDPHLERNKQIQILEGDLPSPINPPSGCVFRTRCPIATQDCSTSKPEVRETSEIRKVACIRA
ncbi:oligopeptide/dipeptide ABC transporter ATP-binding protein, partial [Francisella sp. SYW-9]|uniref:oligopeptide/dipeptide ABC transporter ATP-binding protein n=1 Tax=Francisella sp. SYW-9 TaxID=2610888 RepID=UPI00398D67F1